MAKGQNASRRSQNKDLGKPGPGAGWCHSAENKRRARRMKRRGEKQKLKADGEFPDPGCKFDPGCDTDVDYEKLSEMNPLSGLDESEFADLPNTNRRRTMKYRNNTRVRAIPRRHISHVKL